MANPSQRLLGQHILIVEDEDDARVILAKALRLAGARVQTVATAAQARESYETEQIDAIVCDIGLPDEDGYTFMIKLRAFEKAQGRTAILAIALTAFAQSSDKAKALEAGFDIHWSKPISLSKFTQELASLFARTASST